MRLGEALRAARANAGLSGEKLAERLGISQSRLSRIELGQQAAPADLVRCWAKVIGAPEARCAELVGWAEAASTEAVAWRTAKTHSLVRLQQHTSDFHASAGTIRSFQERVG